MVGSYLTSRITWRNTVLATQVTLLAATILVPSLSAMSIPVITALTMAGLARATFTHGRVHRLALLAFVGGFGLFVASEIIRVLLGSRTGPETLLIHAAGLPAFALLIWAPVRMGRAARTGADRRHGLNTEAMLDGALLAVGASACVVSLLILPLLDSTDPKTWADTVAPIYPLLDVGYLLAVTYLAFVSKPGLKARDLLVGSGVAILAGDLAQAWTRTYEGGSVWTSLSYVIAIILAGAAGTHPSVALLGFGSDSQSRSWSHSRVALLALGLLAPAILLVTVPTSGPAYRATYALAVALGSLVVLARAVRAINDYARTHAELRVQAERDPLTGLANRAAFLDRVSTCMRDAAAKDLTITVLFLDLDQFKPVNDTRGHQTGDALLVEVANRLTGALRDADFAARLGGDEFALVTLDDEQGSVGERLADRVQRLFDEPFHVGALTLDVGAAVGMANTAQTDPGGRTASQLVGAADAAMYQAKRSGTGQWVRAGVSANQAGDASVVWDDAGGRGRWQETENAT